MQSYNFNNIPKTLAQRQQLRQCLLLSKSYFLKEREEVSGAKQTRMYEIDSKVKIFLAQQYGQQLVQSDQSLLRCSQLIYNHIIDKQYAVYVYDLEHVKEIPFFFQILYIFKVKQQWIFIVDFLNTDGFSTKLWSYKVSSHGRLGIVLPNDLKYFHKGLHIYEIDYLRVVNLTSRLTKKD
ncbi:unnamed protein product [Rotaria sp. Silwood2]|nr:unnamed protein product [Rotaria sp. Silwood2]CAF4379383.1 unnamed protein product [Rotaria sp. Silwood2]